MDPTIPGGEYINANYIRQPTDLEHDFNFLSENLSPPTNSYTGSGATTYASINQQPTKNCQSCQLLNKACSQCSMKANEVLQRVPAHS